MNSQTPAQGVLLGDATDSERMPMLAKNTAASTEDDIDTVLRVPTHCSMNRCRTGILLIAGSVFIAGLIVRSLTAGAWPFAEPAPYAHREQNPPGWPPSVHVFSPGDRNIQETFDALTVGLRDRKTGHFSTQRFAALFKPGVYDVDLNVGYYVQILGLGVCADDVVFKGARGIYSPAMDPGGAGSLDTFWRMAENFKSSARRGMLWAVSQAAPLRRVHVAGDLLLHDNGGLASGGFMANVVVDGKVEFGSQQQWFARNSEMRSMLGGAWNFVFVGCTNASPTNNPLDGHSGPSITNIDRAPVSAEKPFISIDESGLYTLQVPTTNFNSQGAHLKLSSDGVRSISFHEVFVARAEFRTEVIQGKLDAGRHVVLSPGIYNLSATLVLRHPGQTLLGLGLATLVAPSDGTPCVRVLGRLPGVRVAGIMLAAATLLPKSVYAHSVLLEWGEVGDDGLPADPGFLFDVFARVGGDAVTASAHTMVRILSGNVVGDNVWLWRADHNKLAVGEKPGWNFNSMSEYHLVTSNECKCAHGLEVHGNNVTMYGLFVEHTLKTQTVWSGDGGRTYFYQCELPYDVTQQSFADKDYYGYQVGNEVQKHEAYGVGVYSFFRDDSVFVGTAITSPEAAGIVFVNPFTKYLNGRGGILSVWNGMGQRSDASTAMMQASGKLVKR